MSVCMCVCVRMCVHAYVSTPRLLIVSGMILIPYNWLSKCYNFYMAAVVSIFSMRGLRIEVYCRNQPNKSKLMLYMPLLSF